MLLLLIVLLLIPQILTPLFLFTGVKMLIRVHEESFVLFFFNSFILLDKKPFFIAAFCVLSAFFIFAFMGNKILRGDDVNAFLKA